MKYLSFQLASNRLKNIAVLLCCLFVLGACSSDSGDNNGGTDVTDGGEINEKNTLLDEKNTVDPPVNTDFSKEDKLASAEGDFSTFFKMNFSKQGKEQIMNNIDAMIDPSIGVYLVYKPGAMPVPKRCTSAEELKETFAYLNESLVQIQCEEVKESEALPYYDCESFDMEGCVFKKVEEGGSLVAAQEQMTELMFTEFSDEEKAQAQKADEAVSVVLVATDAAVSMSFGKVDGKWKIIVINIADYDCGA